MLSARPLARGLPGDEFPLLRRWQPGRIAGRPPASLANRLSSHLPYRTAGAALSMAGATLAVGMPAGEDSPDTPPERIFSVDRLEISPEGTGAFAAEFATAGFSSGLSTRFSGPTGADLTTSVVATRFALTPAAAGTPATSRASDCLIWSFSFAGAGPVDAMEGAVEGFSATGTTFVCEGVADGAASFRSPWERVDGLGHFIAPRGKSWILLPFHILPRVDRDVAELIDNCVDRLDRPVDHPLMALQSTRK